VEKGKWIKIKIILKEASILNGLI